MPGFGEVDRVLHGLAGADLADQDHVRRLPQGVLEGVVPALGVGPHLPLGDDAAAVRVHVLHRVLDGDDLLALGAVDAVDDGVQRRGLAHPRRPGDKHQPGGLLEQLGNDHRGGFTVDDRSQIPAGGIVVGGWVRHPAAQAIAVQVCRIHMEPLMQPYAYVKNEVHNFEFHGLCIRLLSRALVAV